MKRHYFILLGVVLGMTAQAQTIARNDFAVLPEDSFRVIKVQLNDQGHPSCTKLTTAVWVNPKHGTASVVNGDSIRYTPKPNFAGKDSLTYRLCGCILPSPSCDLAKVYITVLQVNDAPVAKSDHVTMMEDAIRVVDVQANDIDPENGILTTAAAGYGPFHGTGIILNGDSIRYTPNPNYNGKDTFCYEICDDAIGSPSISYCDTACVYITILPVDDPPVMLIGDLLDTTLEDVQSKTAWTYGVFHPDANDPLTTTGQQPSNGSATVIGDSICYTPAPNFNGKDTIIYTVCDQAGSCVQNRLIITVIPVNDPVVANDDLGNLSEDGLAVIDVQANDLDPDKNGLITSIVLQPKHGVLTVLANDSIRYRPTLDFFGADSFQYRICEKAPGTDCDTAWVRVTVNGVDDTPVINGGAIRDTTLEDQMVCMNLKPLTYHPDGPTDTLTYAVSISPKHGSVTLINGQLCYTPSPDYHGPDTLTYVVCDQQNNCVTNTIYLTVTAVPDKPLAVNDTLVIAEDSHGVVVVQLNDVDYDGNGLITKLLGQPGNGSAALNGNSVAYTPAPDFHGQDTVWYIICDSLTQTVSDTAFIVISVTPVNDPPIAVNDTFTISPDTTVALDVLVNDFDVDGDALAVSIIVFPINGVATVLGNMDVEYSPKQGFAGADSFVYAICDGQYCDTAQVYITITSSQPAPVAVTDSVDVQTNKFAFFMPLSNDYDPNGNNISLTQVMNPVLGSITQLGNTVRYDAPAGFKGIDSLHYVICDDGVPSRCDTGTVIFVIADPGVGGVKFWPPTDGGPFTIHGLEAYPDNHVVVFNRWGDIVMDRRPYLNDWNGQQQASWRKIGGQPAPEGVYYYIIQLDPVSKPITGYFYLAR